MYYDWQVEEAPIACASTRIPVTAAVNNIPSADITSNQPTTICPGDSVTLSVPDDANNNYIWSNSATSSSIIVSTNGTFTVTVSDVNCSATSTPATVTISNNAVAGITPSSSTSFCEGGSVDLTASTGTSYLWSTGAVTPTITVNSSGSYSVTVAVSGSCSAISNPTVVTVNQLPSVSLGGLNTQYYSTDAAVALAGTPSGGTFTGTGVTANSFDPAAAGVGGPYTITYSYTDVNGCEGTSTSDVTVLLGTGLLAIEGISKVNVYPNPSNGQFQLSLDSDGMKKIDIAVSNSIGQKVYEEKNIAVNNAYTRAMNLENMAKGIYQLIISSGKKASHLQIGD